MNYTLYKGDCLEEMKKIEDGSVDMILCDLPYGTTACAWDAVIPFSALWGHYRRIINPLGAIVLTASQPFTSSLIMSSADIFKYSLVWEKSKASNFVHAAHQPLKAHEDICVFSKYPAAKNSAGRNMVYNPQKIPGKPYNKGAHRHGSDVIDSGMKGANIVNETGDRSPRSVLYFRTAESEGKFHPTQKPVALMEYLIRTYTNEGDTVLDNCAGSFTTGVACLNTGRNFIGIERDDHYFKVGSERMAKRAAELEAAQAECDTTGSNRSDCQADLRLKA